MNDEPEFLKKFIALGSTLSPSQTFVSGCRLAVLLRLTCENRSAHTCLLVLRPDSAFTAHVTLAHRTLAFDTQSPVPPRCTFFARPQIHALFLRPDTSGLLLRHTGSRISVVSRWTSLPQLTEVWSSPKDRRLKCTWSTARRSVMVVNERHIDWESQGSINYFELTL